MKKSSEKVQLVDRLVMSIAKRKRSMPQKFLGEVIHLFLLIIVLLS